MDNVRERMKLNESFMDNETENLLLDSLHHIFVREELRGRSRAEDFSKAASQNVISETTFKISSVYP